MKKRVLIAGAFAVLGLSVGLAGCGEDTEKRTAIADCQLEAHREFDDRVSDPEKHKFALGESSTACIKAHGFNPVAGKADCQVEAPSADVGKAFVKPLLECWSK